MPRRKRHRRFSGHRVSWYPIKDERTLKDAFMDGMAQMPKTWSALWEMLLAIGGDLAIPGRGEDDLDNKPLLSRGQFFPGHQCFQRMAPIKCHRNVALLYDNGAPIWIATGYALSDDGRWRSHTWGVLKKKVACDNGEWSDGDVVETTEPREAYFGYVLKKDEAEQFVDANYP